MAQKGDKGKWTCHVITADSSNNAETRNALVDVNVLGNFLRLFNNPYTTPV